MTQYISFRRPDGKPSFGRLDGDTVHDLGAQGAPAWLKDVLGGDLSALTPTASQCILMHHERMDGSGYPGGLSGALIPDHVRAVCVADVYDALTSARPYAPAMPAFQALRLMREEMTQHFDLDAYKRLVLILSDAKMV